MPKKKGMGRYTYPASLVGVALLLLVGLAQLLGLLGRSLLSLAGTNAAAGDAQNAIEWLGGAINLLAAAGTFIPPLVFMLKSGKRAGLRLNVDKGAVPVMVLLPLFIGVMLVLNAATSLVRSLAAAIAGAPLAESSALPGTAFGRILYFLASCVAAAVLEELVFRGGIQPLLRNWGPRFAILVTSLLFTLMHGNLWDLPTVFVLSLLLGYVAEISGSVRPCMILHFANNAFSFVIRLIQQEMDLMVAIALLLWLLVVFFLFFGGAVWAVRSMKLGPKLRLEKDSNSLGNLGARFGWLFRVPFFDVGFAVLLVHFIMRLVGG